MSILSKHLLPPFLGVATLAWVVGGTYWYKNQFCDMPASNAASLTATSTGKHLPFYFPQGDSKPVFTSESFLTFKETTDFLNENRSKILVINGLFAQKEITSSTNAQLGLERAKAIKSVLLNLGAASTSIETKGEQRQNLFFENQQLFDGVEFTMMDNKEGRFQALNLFFQKNKYQFQVNADLKSYFHELNNYLSLHPTAKVKITAHRENTEGGAVSKNRLTFIHNFLENHDFLPEQLDFEDVNSEIPLGKEGYLKNRRIEIRLIVP